MSFFCFKGYLQMYAGKRDYYTIKMTSFQFSFYTMLRPMMPIALIDNKCILQKVRPFNFKRCPDKTVSIQVR